jgi:crotonobetaine/carnitine-CoA ligase
MNQHDSVWSPGTQRTVIGELREAVAKFAEQPYLVFGEDVHSYRDVWERAAGVASGLRELGVSRGDTVVALLDSTIDSVAVWFGANMLGAVWVPTNTAYKGEFLRHQVADAGARVVVAESDYAERLLQIAEGVPALTSIVYRGDLPAAPSGDDIALVPFRDVSSSTPLAEPVEVRPSELSMLVYTSGTTGPSKGCMLSHNYVCNVAAGSTRHRTADDVIWTPLPLFHLNASATTVLATAMLGMRAHIYPRFSLSNFWPQVRESGATIVTLLGVMIPLIAYMEDTDDLLACKGQIRYAGGAPYPEDVRRIWHERFGVEHVGSSVFGLTETTFLTNSRAGDIPPFGSAGRANDDFEVRIFDEDDREVPTGESGEIVARPKRPHVMFEGYWNRPEATQAVMRNMWFHTGDIGRFDEAGWLYFVDRKKDYLRRRGENISSQELENTFLSHPDIVECAVHAVPSELSEDDVKLTAVLREGADVSEVDVFRWSVDRLPYFAMPRYVEFRAELPRNPTGKILKYQLRDEGATPATWDFEGSGIVLDKR